MNTPTLKNNYIFNISNLVVSDYLLERVYNTARAKRRTIQV